MASQRKEKNAGVVLLFASRESKSLRAGVCRETPPFYGVLANRVSVCFLNRCFTRYPLAPACAGKRLPFAGNHRGRVAVVAIRKD